MDVTRDFRLSGLGKTETEVKDNNQYVIMEKSYGHGCWGEPEYYWKKIEVPSFMTYKQVEAFVEELSAKHPDNDYEINIL